MRVSIVADERHHDASIAILLLDIREIHRVREVHRRRGITLRVLVLRLQQDHRSSIRNLSLSHNLGDALHIVISSVLVSGLCRPQQRRIALQPTRVATSRDFSIDVRAWTREQVDPGSGGRLEERLEREDALGSEVALLAFEERPVDIEAHAVVAEGLDLLEDIEPEAGDWEPERMEFTRVEEDAFAVDEEGVLWRR